MDLVDAEGLQDGDDEFAHVDIVVHNQNPQPVEPIPAHSSRPSAHLTP
jgi:hypothetical protein